MYLRLFYTDQLVRFTFKKSMISFVVGFWFFFPEDSETFMLYYLLSFLCLNNKHADTNGSLKVFHQDWRKLEMFWFPSYKYLVRHGFPTSIIKGDKISEILINFNSVMSFISL